MSEKYGVDYPYLTKNCLDSNYNIISKVNLKFAELLDKNHISYEMEFLLKRYRYDFHIQNTNILIEINPTFTHTCKDTGVFDRRNKYYHHYKTKFALDHNYICICVWDWINWLEIIDLIRYNNIELKKSEVKLHYSKKAEHILSNNNNDVVLLNQGYLPIYDDGFSVIKKG